MMLRGAKKLDHSNARRTLNGVDSSRDALILEVALSQVNQSS